MTSLQDLYRHAANPDRARFDGHQDEPLPSFAEEVRKQTQFSPPPPPPPPPPDKPNKRKSRSRSRSRGSRRSRSRSSSGSSGFYRHRSHRSHRRKRSRRNDDTEYFDDVASTDEMDVHLRKSHEEMEAEKMTMLAELKRICPDSKMWTNPKININSAHGVIAVELNVQRQNIDEDEKVFLARLVLGVVCRGVEWGSKKIYQKVNGKFLQLEGWAQSIMRDTEQFDPILRRCYRKMFPQGMGKADPFIELAMALGVSAITYGLINRGMASAQGGNGGRTTVPSDANTFLDRNAPTPAETRANTQAQRQARQARQNNNNGGGGGGNNMLSSIMGMLGGGGGENNPLGQIFGMMQNGGLQSFMQGVQNNTPPQEPPNDPFKPTSTEPVSDIPDPMEELRKDAFRPPPPRRPRRPQPPRPPNNNSYSQPVRKPNQPTQRPLTPPFDERTGQFKGNEHKAKRIPSPVFGEPTPTTPIQEDDAMSMQTMSCSSSDEEDEVGQID